MTGSRHLKTFVAPAFWPIMRKEYKWVVKPSPGPHAVSRCLPLLIIVRDVLKYAETSREARKLISEGYFLVDGRVRRDYKYPVGVMDVVSIKGYDEHYRVIPIPIAYLGLVKINSGEARFKLSRIENKTCIKGGHVQLNLHDGRNIIVRVSDPRNPVEDTYETLGTIQLSLPDQQIMSYIPLKEGVVAIISGGRNVGRVGKVISIKRGMRRYRSVVTLEDKNGNKFQTSLDYVFPVGVDNPLITLPEGAW